MGETRKLEHINTASVISAFAVVFLHTNSVFWDFNPGAFYWRSANVIESVFYFAVPIFFMISGATLLDFNERYDLKTYFKKRFSRAVVPFLAWSAIGLFAQIFVVRWISLSQVTPKYLLEGLLTGKLVEIYWFFIPLFAIYLSIPLFAAVPKEKRQTLFTYLAGLGFLLNLLPQFLLGVFGKQLNNDLSIGVVAGYLFFVPVGYLISHYDISKRNRVIIYLLGVAGLAMHIFGTYFYSVSANEISGVFKGYSNVPCVLYSVAVFTFIKYATPAILKNSFIARAVNFLRSYTLSIYLLHIYLLWAATGVLKGIQYSILFRLLGPFFIIAVAICAAWLIRKIPVVRRILP